MIEINTNAQLPKSYSSLTSYLDTLQTDISSVVKLLLGTGVASVSEADFSASISTSYSLVNNEYELYFESNYPNVISASYVDDSTDRGLLIDSKISGSASYVIPFDEENSILNGSTNNPIEVPYPSLTSLPIFPQHKLASVASVVYINGTPQPASNISVVSKSQATNTAEIAFLSVLDGFIYPDPVAADGTLTDLILSGPMQTWFSTFGDPIELTFSNLNIKRTNRPLILDLYDVNTATRTYLLVQSSFQEDKPYYEIVGTSKLRVHIPAATQAAFPPASTQMRVYFATTLSRTEIDTSSNRFFRQYQLPATNLTPDDTELAIFAISRTTGEVKELVSSSNALIGSLYSLDYVRGILSVYNIGGAIPEDELIAIGGFKYAPPIKPFNISDYPNTVTLHFQSGGIYTKSGVTGTADLPNNLYVYFVPAQRLASVISYLDRAGKVATAASLRQFSNKVIISETTLTSWAIPQLGPFDSFTVEPIQLGTLAKSGLSYSFTSNPTAFDPYAKLLALAGNLSLISQNSFTTQKTTEIRSLPNGTDLIIPIDYMPANTTEAALYGLTGKVLVTDAANTATTKQYSVEVGYYDPVTDAFSSVQNLGTFDSGINNAFIDIRQATFPTASLWSTLTPTTDRYLAFKVTVINPAGETDFQYDYDLTTYYNLKY